MKKENIFNEAKAILKREGILLSGDATLQLAYDAARQIQNKITDQLEAEIVERIEAAGHRIGDFREFAAVHCMVLSHIDRPTIYNLYVDGKPLCWWDSRDLAHVKFAVWGAAENVSYYQLTHGFENEKQ